MKVISFSDIQSLQVSTEQCYEWIEYMIREKEKMILPPKISMKPFNGVFCNVMPSIISDENNKLWGGVKIVSRYPNRVPSLESQILLMDAESGEHLALMDGTWITAMRTGAVAAHSIQLLSRNAYSVIGIFGLGNTARATLLMLLSKIGNRIINIKLLKYKSQEIDFINRFSCFQNINFTVVESIEELILDSDIVISGTTYLENDICSNKCFKKGVLVIPIHTRGFSNCDLFFDKVFADDLGHVCHFKYFDQFKYFAEVSDIVNGKARGREDDDERIIAYNIGISIHDIYMASKIYELIMYNENKSLFPEYNMAPPRKKFWV